MDTQNSQVLGESPIHLAIKSIYKTYIVDFSSFTVLVNATDKASVLDLLQSTTASRADNLNQRNVKIFSHQRTSVRPCVWGVLTGSLDSSCTVLNRTVDLNDFQAGEFAQSPDVSPVATRPAALGTVLSSLAALFLPDLYKLYLQSSTLADRLTGCRLGLSSEQLAKHRRALARAQRREQRRFNTLIFRLSEVYTQFAADNHFSSVVQPKPDLIIPLELPVIDEPLGQAQCWICPHCYDDAYHQSDENGCEWQYKQDAIDAKRYRFLRESCKTQFSFNNTWQTLPGLLIFDGIDLDIAIDKTMEVSS